MTWATHLIEKLESGEVVSFRPRGQSMKGKVESGQLVTVAPLDSSPAKGDVVLCAVRGKHYLHLVKAVRGNRYQIGNNKGRVNGWIGSDAVYGRMVG